MTLGIVKRTEEEFQQWLMMEPGFVAALMAYDDEPVVLEAYQREFLTNRSRFRWVNKSRQVGFSFLFALEALARCHLRSKHTAVFVSYNMDDAKEKVLTARQLPRSCRSRTRSGSSWTRRRSWRSSRTARPSGSRESCRTVEGARAARRATSTSTSSRTT